MDLTSYKSMLFEAEQEIDRLQDTLKDAEGVIRFCRRRIQELEQMTLPLQPESNEALIDLSGKTIPEAAHEVMLSKGTAMRVGDVAQAMVAAGFRDSTNLTVSVTTAIRRRTDLFRKVDRGLFAARNGET